jgi:hypothetical protein
MANTWISKVLKVSLEIDEPRIVDQEITVPPWTREKWPRDPGLQGNGWREASIDGKKR